MRQQLFVLIRRSPAGPQILHDEARKHQDPCRYPDGTSNVSPYLDSHLCPLFIPHVHHHVREEEACDGVPRPTLHPPSRDNEGDVGFDSPCVACVGDDDHGHVDSVALSVDDVDDPERLRRE